MVKPELKPLVPFSVCIACLLLPLKFVLTWLVAAFVHEQGHYLALRIVDARIYSISIGVSGATMKTEPLTTGKEVFATMAGPIFGLLLLLFVRWFPLLAICGFVQSAYNLLPVFPLDGGRLLRSFMQILPGNISDNAVKAAEILIFMLLVCLAVYITFRLLLGPLPILTVAFLWLRRKLSCKHSTQRVQ